MTEQEKKQYLSVTEAANLLGISRQTVHNKIKNGEIKATKIGRVFAISREEFKKIVGDITGHFLSEDEKHKLDEIIDKTVEEYGEVLKWLGNT
ncbi:MAG: excisionase family DNA-binding protein [Candidatus Omnitrophota bacterium]